MQLIHYEGNLEKSISFTISQQTALNLVPDNSYSAHVNRTDGTVDDYKADNSDHETETNIDPNSN